jgi:tripartite-type tricarboxylate transporter receptor subunit TctC
VVNYNGLPDIINATLRNDIQFFLAVPASVAGQIADNKLVAIANAAPQRNEKFPNVPTARESGVDFLSGFSFGIWVPSKTPDAIVAKIAADMEKAALSPEYVARMKTLNFEVPQRPRDYPMRAQQEDRQYTEIARQIGVQPH